MDTDTLLAVLSSLVDPLICDQATLLDALVQCDGDAETAAEFIRKRYTEGRQGGQKRKRTNKLTDWLEGPSGQLLQAGGVRSTSEPVSKRASSSIARAESPPARPSSKKPISFAEKRSEKPISISSTVITTPSKGKTVTNDEFMTLLQPPNSKGASKQPARLPPLTLATPELVSKHTSCTLHTSVLPQELACRLFYKMLHKSQDWERNKWWLFDRVVESPHRTSFYRRSPANDSRSTDSDLQEAAQYWYNGRITEPPSVFPPAMEEACTIIERVVNQEMHKRKRFPLEWGGEPPQAGDGTRDQIIWRANVAAANCYEGAKESVGPHSDQLTYLGPYPTIASLSLGTSRIFRLREVIPVDEKDERSARTYNIPLSHNSLIIMHASTQEMFKHSIPPQSAIDLFHPPFPPPDTNDGMREYHAGDISSNARINITFRFYRPDFRAETTPRCKCGVPCILRADMKNRYTQQPPARNPRVTRDLDEESSRKDIVAKYWWTCYAGAQNDGKGCGLWKVMDVVAEGRGPFVGPVSGGP